MDEQPRTLLGNIDRAEMVALAGTEECCGFGGLFSVKNSGISTAMGQRKTLNLADSGGSQRRCDDKRQCQASDVVH